MTVTASRILVVEDDRRLAATLQRVLVAEGHHVEISGDGMDALRRAREHAPDLAVLDVMLPGLDGIAVCRRLRETAQFPILMLTALSGTEDRVRGLDSGADDYLVKPFAYEELLARVRALLRRSELQLNDLYRRGGAYEYRNGVNPAAIISLAGGIVVALIGLVVPDLKWLYSYAWFVGFGVSAAVYTGLMSRRST